MSLNLKRARKWLTETDGYSILAPEFFCMMGFDEPTLQRLTRKYSDDPALGKNAAHRKDGKPGPVEGIAEFSAIHTVASMLGVDLNSVPSFLGRGKQFRAWRDACVQAIDAKSKPKERKNA